MVKSYSAGPHPISPQPPPQPAKPAAEVERERQAEQARVRADLAKVRQQMGAGSGAASDPAVQKYSALRDAEQQLAEVQPRIDEAQDEYRAFVDRAKMAAEAGGTGAGKGGVLKLAFGDSDKVDIWFHRAFTALREKHRISMEQWGHGLRINGDDQNTMAIRFSKASASEKEAYVQRNLADFDDAMAEHELFRKYMALWHGNVLLDEEAHFSVAEIARQREVTELALRDEVIRLSAGPSEETAKSSPQMESPEKVKAALDAYMDQLRKDMGAGSGAADDPEVRKYALALPGPKSNAEQLAEAQQRIDAVQSEYEGLAQARKDEAARSQTWAQPKS